MTTSTTLRQPPPAPDGGWGWVAVGAAFVAHIITSGYMLSLSVFLVEWQLYFDINAKTAGLVGVILGFMGPVMGLPAGGLSKTFGCRLVVIISGLSMSLGMLLSMFATNIYHLCLTTILISIGVGFTYQPAVTVIGHYFQKRLGLANGIAMSGVGIGMLAVPPFLQLLIDTFTWQRTFPILAALVLLLVVCGLLFRPSDRELYFINEKTKHKQLADDAAEDEDTSAAESSRTCYFYLWRCLKFFGLQLIWQMPSINFIFVAFCLLGFGYYSSLVFFTSKAVFDLGIEQTTASWLISLVGIGSFSFRLFHGVLIDLKIVSPMMLFIVSTMMCCISDLLNPFTASFAGLAICAFFLGAGSGMAIAVTIVCIREAVPPTNVPNAWGISMTFLGTGNLIGVYFMEQKSKRLWLESNSGHGACLTLSVTENNQLGHCSC
ncbi:monocarboxylate transporter 2-like isoform X2 [Apostichopus japonicus]|uniref:monocarboxylate transporter 2-like isoform X2 n=1 Tax=Stichopus japonicus TaxID=307972 RepID=UPI003AB6BDC5